MVQDIMKARTTFRFEVVIKDAARDNLHAIPQLVRSLVPCTPLDQLIIRPGETGGMLTQTEYQLARSCSEENGNRERQIATHWNDQAACICNQGYPCRNYPGN